MNIIDLHLFVALRFCGEMGVVVCEFAHFKGTEAQSKGV